MIAWITFDRSLSFSVEFLHAWLVGMGSVVHLLITLVKHGVALGFVLCGSAGGSSTGLV